MPSPKTQVGRSLPEDHRLRERAYSNGDAMEMAISLLAEMEAEGRLISACDLLRHVSWAEFVEEEMEEVRRRAGRTTGIGTRSRGGDLDGQVNSPPCYFQDRAYTCAN